MYYTVIKHDGHQARIQDFEMGGEFLSQYNTTKAWLRDKKKKKRKERRRLRKRGVKIHPFHLPWIRACELF